MGSDEDAAQPQTVIDRPKRMTLDPFGPSGGGSMGSGGSVPHSSMSMTTTADVMHNDEVHRMRLVIRMGWLLSLAGMAIVPFFHAPLLMNIALVAAGSLGIAVSFPLHQAFADPRRYTPRAVVTLVAIATGNSAVAILYFGAFSVAPVIMVIGIHFIARGENDRAGRVIWYEGAALHALTTIAIACGLFKDPGVFASDEPITSLQTVLAGLFVQGMYALAYVTARSIRIASLESIEQLHAATRLTAKRSALMQELRAELERALRVGGPGRYTDQTVGSFKLGVVIGRGAMGEVYEAIHVTTGEPAALKLLRRELLADPTHVARFLREARASGLLASPHVVRILETADDDAPLPYLAMERLHGKTLAEILRGEPRLAPATVVELVTQVGEGVDAAGAAGIVHRDLKPQNLMLCDPPLRSWRILDFGVATLSENAGTLTNAGIVGTPNYMAPEQARGDRVDTRADLCALAAVAYRCLTGRHPYTGADTPTLLYAVVHRAPARPGSFAALDSDVDRWTALAMAKDRDDRFATAAELAQMLALALRGELPAKLRKKADALIKALPWEGE